jgi:hypothetical protein
MSDEQKKQSIGNKIFRVIRFFVMNGLIFFCAWRGVHADKMAWNVFVFVQWLSTLVWLFAYCSKDNPTFMKTDPTQRPVLPDWYPALFDFVMSLTLAAFGHFFYACLSVFQLLCESAYWQAYRLKANGQEPKATA